jgi:adenine-specific DNA-methyltransferase
LPEQPERLSTQTNQPSTEVLKALQELIPGVIADGVIDAQRISEIVGLPIASAKNGKERFGLMWAGKNESVKAFQAASFATLIPLNSDQKNYDKAENLFIEGDNLEALKILQKSYNDKIKLIYIDPPYNTGKDFIYKDDFSDTKKHYLEITGQLDDEGNRISANSEIAGRKHSNWLSMMYPRLALARNLLKEDGVIFVSIDDNEVSNLKALMNEIFGEENFEGQIHWRRRHNQPNDPTKMLGLVAEHILVYARNSQALKAFGVGKIGLTGDFSNPDNDERGEWSTKPWKVGSDQSGSKYSITTPTGKVYTESWMGEESTFLDLLKDKRIVFPNNGNGTPRKKYFRSEREAEGQSATNWWPHDQFGNNQAGNRELEELFGIKNVFSNPKPLELIMGILAVGNVQSEDLVLDFFAGSGTTGHAVMKKNSEDGGNRKFILINVAEEIPEDSAALDLGYKNVSEVTVARLNKVMERSKDSNVGLKILKIGPSNFDVNFPEDSSDIPLVKERTLTGEKILDNLLIEISLKVGIPLDVKWLQYSAISKQAFKWGGFVVVLDDLVTNEIVNQLPTKGDISTVIFLEDSFAGNDSVKANTFFALKQANINMKTI